MSALVSDPERVALTDELHARPFTPLHPPARVLHFAFRPEPGASAADAARAHLNLALEAVGARPVETASQGGPQHHVASVDGLRLKWERHTEFVSLMLAMEGGADDPVFAPDLDPRLPPDFLARAPGPVIAASMVSVRGAADADAASRMMREDLSPLLDADSLAVSWVGGGSALAMGDFRIDASGFTRFAVVTAGALGPRRLGRIVQRLIELETYRVLSMLALPSVRALGPRLAAIETDLTDLASAMVGPRGGGAEERGTLVRLTELSAEIERLSAAQAFRVSAGRAYARIVDERLDVLREQPMNQRQTFREFMTRRYKPAIRTIEASDARLSALAIRAERAANLLRTRVDVALEEQNQALLRSMDRRAQTQLRLQETVEGLSVVAISYYAVNLGGYLLAPFAEGVGLSETIAKAIIAPLVIGGVWWFVRRIRARLDQKAEAKAPAETTESAALRTRPR